MKIGKINRQSIAISGFTSVLSNYEGMPTELYSIGSLPNNRPPTVAIIGSRKPTPYGEEVTRRFASALAKRGVVIISGLAYGIDAIAHQAALDASGKTIAILANGLHRIYPTVHTALARQIIATGGALVSEQAPGVEAHKHHFLARNRLVSGLADAVLVTEATDRSGTFSTVSHALTQNKEVFAVPGPIDSLLSAGPNRLIQQGAQVALEPEDILRVIMPAPRPKQTQLVLGDTPVEVQILKYIKKGRATVDSLNEVLHLSLSELQQTITLMELKGLIQSNGGRLFISQ
jgi:DNA processing protein